MLIIYTFAGFFEEASVKILSKIKLGKDIALVMSLFMMTKLPHCCKAISTETHQILLCC